MASRPWSPPDVWLDEVGRLRRLAFSTRPDPEDDLSPPFAFDTVLELRDFGVPVEIRFPRRAWYGLLRMPGAPYACPAVPSG
jgi:hypothetical protein